MAARAPGVFRKPTLQTTHPQPRKQTHASPSLRLSPKFSKHFNSSSWGRAVGGRVRSSRFQGAILPRLLNTQSQPVTQATQEKGAQRISVEAAPGCQAKHVLTYPLANQRNYKMKQMQNFKRQSVFIWFQLTCVTRYETHSWPRYFHS